jgi:hypothetical protein
MDIIKTFGFSERNDQYTDQAVHWKTNFSLISDQNIQTDSGANPAAYSMAKA